MTKQLEALIAEMKAAAERATPLQLDTAQLKRGNDGWIECPCCEGAGDVEAESDFCNIDGKALGVQFYGIGEHHGLAEQYFRQVSPANVLVLISVLEQLQQHENVHYADAAEVEIASLRNRVAELEASPLAVKLPTQEKYDDPLSAHEAIKDCAEAIRAAGGTVCEGE
ncbi:ead/Ea22-like family protein [Cedecea neteri]|uniref:ead/Ea22-like family protein n=1 Tax=Cedecea neteri TaxID=158822 RepID=UPI0028936C4F|nr:ead/Ea22-like family protein [Cedecea neteri]WNJ80582.1 ead/Ea22-like family protein [Cedecea neteri]